MRRRELRRRERDTGEIRTALSRMAASMGWRSTRLRRRCDSPSSRSPCHKQTSPPATVIRLAVAVPMLHHCSPPPSSSARRVLPRGKWSYRTATSRHKEARRERAYLLVKCTELTNVKRLQQLLYGCILLWPTALIAKYVPQTDALVTRAIAYAA